MARQQRPSGEPPRRPLRIRVHGQEQHHTIVRPSDPAYEAEYQLAARLYQAIGKPMPYAEGGIGE